jgi:hypothetical protein
MIIGLLLLGLMFYFHVIRPEQKKRAVEEEKKCVVSETKLNELVFFVKQCEEICTHGKGLAKISNVLTICPFVGRKPEYDQAHFLGAYVPVYESKLSDWGEFIDYSIEGYDGEFGKYKRSCGINMNMSKVDYYKSNGLSDKMILERCLDWSKFRSYFGESVGLDYDKDLDINNLSVLIRLDPNYATEQPLVQRQIRNYMSELYSGLERLYPKKIILANYNQPSIEIHF